MTEEHCDICGGTMVFADVHIGHGDGSGQRFAHEVCYWRERANRYESELADAKAEIGRLVKAISTIHVLQDGERAPKPPISIVHPDILRLNGDYR